MAQAVKCPGCNGTMGPHCPKWRCKWAFCVKCAIRVDLKTGRWIGKDTQQGLTE